MAINRAQLEEQIVGLSDDPAEEYGSGTGLKPLDTEQFVDPVQNQIDEMAKALQPKPFNFDASFDKYSNRLAPYFSESTRPTFYDMASDIGKAMLSADPTAGAFRSAGIGFSNFNERLRKDKESRIALDRQIGLQAMQMAMADERAATDYLNKLELERIKLAGKPYDPLIYEVPDPKTGESVTIEVDPRNPVEVAAIRRIPGATQIKLPDSQITIDSRTIPETTYDKESAKTLNELEKEWADEAKQGISQNQLTNMFLYQLQKLGPDGFGVVEAGTLGARQILDDLGIVVDKTISDQQLVNTLGTRIAMALVGQTKGAITEMEMRLFLAASPTLASTYEGALKQAALLQRIGNLNIKRAEDWNQAVQEGILDGAETASDRLRVARNWELGWQKKNPFLTAEETGELRRFAAKENKYARTLRTALRPEAKSSTMNTDFSNVEAEGS
jgi:hypothetical protein